MGKPAVTGEPRTKSRPDERHPTAHCQYVNVTVRWVNTVVRVRSLPGWEKGEDSFKVCKKLATGQKVLSARQECLPVLQSFWFYQENKKKLPITIFSQFFVFSGANRTGLQFWPSDWFCSALLLTVSCYSAQLQTSPLHFLVSPSPACNKQASDFINPALLTELSTSKLLSVVRYKPRLPPPLCLAFPQTLRKTRSGTLNRI